MIIGDTQLKREWSRVGTTAFTPQEFLKYGSRRLQIPALLVYLRDTLAVDELVQELPLFARRLVARHTPRIFGVSPLAVCPSLHYYFMCDFITKKITSKLIISSDYSIYNLQMMKLLFEG